MKHMFGAGNRMVDAAKQMVALAVLAVSATHAYSQAFPTKPIRFIVGFPPGGATDHIARAISPRMAEVLGQSVVVENNGGASGLIASQTVQRATPDGHTILLMVTGGHLLRPLLDPSTPFDPIKDFTPITQLNDSVFAIAASMQIGPKSIEDMIDQARKFPMKLSYGTAGLGTETHLLMERIGAIIKGPMQVVGYKGGGPAVADMIGGQIPLVIQPVVTFLGQARAGKARILTVLLPRRWELLPDVPAITEFIPSFQKPSGGAGVWGPANLPMPVAQRLQGAMASAMSDPGLRQKLIAEGQIPVGSAPQEFAEELVKSKVLFEQLLKGVNLKQ